MHPRETDGSSQRDAEFHVTTPTLSSHRRGRPATRSVVPRLADSGASSDATPSPRRRRRRIGGSIHPLPRCTFSSVFAPSPRWGRGAYGPRREARVLLPKAFVFGYPNERPWKNRRPGAQKPALRSGTVLKRKSRIGCSERYDGEV
jgi:hypothetical protein